MSNMMLSRKKVLKAQGKAAGRFNVLHDQFIGRLSHLQLKKFAGILKKRKIERWELRDYELQSITKDSTTIAIYKAMVTAKKLHESLTETLLMRTA